MIIKGGVSALARQLEGGIAEGNAPLSGVARSHHFNPGRVVWMPFAACEVVAI